MQGPSEGLTGWFMPQLVPGRLPGEERKQRGALNPSLHPKEPRRGAIAAKAFLCFGYWSHPAKEASDGAWTISMHDIPDSAASLLDEDQRVRAEQLDQCRDCQCNASNRGILQPLDPHYQDIGLPVDALTSDGRARLIPPRTVSGHSQA